ncbi:ammonium transporter [Apilactobacillus micheneri]|uniref:Ammonium transporter n=1 Tax=Apilactobacillus micheneri TaxID=1899430 RepID=A0ABY2YWK7_9LACO|nr:ammonium transporter [Apilactobacillus micheneri]TPR24509.1 ammonium transporter [Apilactobacillus micheneri]TPR25820.1 ammonium transporter [Apilactobacillus micheneri]TPR28010.1 ammonium transporter [Apilactobacillus micheneri]TPR29501.1 ammonium transporter [Apilactobacillus micheneri]TPR30287.1 ammonium transporter [Apilactobacillus micheneri]
MDLASTSFVFLSSILVLFMTPGLAFFYGGLVSKKNVVNTMLSVFIITGLAILLWIILGYSLSFSGNIGGFIGNLSNPLMHGIDLKTLMPNKIPTSVYAIFEMMFAVITPALFVGSVVGRIHFKFLLVFIILWSIVLYYPMVHMVWSPNGILAKLGTLDFAGGTVVHINAGITALILSIFLGKRMKGNRHAHHYNLPWVLLGTTILWIGWYGFNAGSALAVNNVAMQATMTTTVATATSMLVWMLLDMYFVGKPQLDGVCTGTLCGLVGITPAAGFVTITGSFVIGIVATFASYLFVNYLKPKIGVDDVLDAFGCHGVSGIVGSILTGFLATKSVNSAVTTNGLFYGGGFHMVFIQLIATFGTIIFVVIACSIIISLLRLVMPMRVTKQEEMRGLDQSEHGENADYTVSINDRAFNKNKDIEVNANEFKGQVGHLNNPNLPKD